MPRRLLTLALFAIVLPAAQAGTLDRIRAEGVLHCGGIARPGLLFPGRDGTWHGLEADICRALAAAVLGEGARTEIHAYRGPQTEAAAHDGADAVFFMTASEILAAELLAVTVPGRPVFFATSGAMVPAGSPAHTLADLAGTPLCVEPGTGPERSLAAWFAARHLSLDLFPFQETDEMLDAYEAGRCHALAGETTALAALALQATADGHPSRLLPSAVGANPIMANTGQGDAQWAAIVAWSVDTLLVARGDGATNLPLDGPTLGLAPNWQTRLLQPAGTYADILRRNLGEDSSLHLPSGPNAPWTDGGIMCPPFSE